jgi:hypothetical protein
MPRLGGCLPGLLLLTIAFGVPVALQVAGVRTTAHVEKKTERVRVMPYTGEWYHAYGLVLQFDPRNKSLADPTTRSPMSDSLRLSAATDREGFDRVRAGSTVDVVYLPFRPSIGRLADRSFLHQARDVIAVPGVGLALVLALAIVVAVWMSSRSSPSAGGAAGTLVRGVVYAACFVTAMTASWLGFQNPESVPESAVNTPAVGRVAGVQRIDRTLFSLSNSEHSSEPLAQPFDVVEVEFTPSPGLVVHAADAVDSGTVRGLAVDSLLRIRYDARAPRTMRIDGGTRTFRARNEREMVRSALLAALLFLAVFGIGALFSRRRRTRARRAAPAP